MSEHIPEALAELRISDTERTQAHDVLSSHFVEGRLDPSELDERIGQITAARTFGDLAPVFQGLPGGLPFGLGADGLPVQRDSAVPAIHDGQAEVDQELTAVTRKGKLVERVDSIGLGIALVLFFLLMIARVPFFWAVWPIYGVSAVVVRLVVGLGGDEEKAYEEVKKAEAAERADRLRVALQRRRELEGPDA